MEKIPLAEFDFNVDDVVRGAAKIKEAIVALKEEQKKLIKSNQEGTTAFVKNEAELKSLNKEYRDHVKVLTDTSKEAQQAVTREDRLALVLDKEATTIQGLRAQNKELNALRNSANLTTEEGRKELELLNAKLDENNDLIKENVDQYTQQKINIGNYTESIQSALQGLTIYGVNIGQVGKNIGGMATGFKAATAGMSLLTRASLAFIATGIGAIIAALGIAFFAVKNALDRSEESTNKLRKAFAPFTGMLSKILSLLEPFGEFLLDGIVKGLELAEQAVYTMIDGLAVLANVLGFEEWASSIAKFNEQLKEGAAASTELAEAEAQLAKNQRVQERLQLEYQRRAEKQRQIRDDVSRSEEERLEANRELGRVLDEQLEKERGLAEQALRTAELNADINGRTEESLLRIEEAKTKIAEIDERITGQRSEQLTNEVAIIQEGIDKAREAAEKRIANLEIELELYREKNRVLGDDAEAEIQLLKQTAERRREILEQQLRSNLITKKEYELESLRITNEILDAEMAYAEEQRQLEIEREEERIARIEQAEKESIDRLNNYKEQQADIRFELERLRLEAEAETKFELKKAELFNQEQAAFESLQKQLDDNQLTQEQYDELSTQTTQKYSILRRNIAKEESQYNADLKERELQLQLNMTKNILGSIAELFGKESAAGKAAAVAQALINTYQGITSALTAPWPLSVPAVAVAAATGFKAVKDILATDVPNPVTGESTGGGSRSSGSAMSTFIPTSASAAVQQQIGGQLNPEVIGDAITSGVREGAAQGTEQGVTNASENGQILNASGF